MKPTETWEEQFNNLCEFSDGGVYVPYDKTVKFIEKEIKAARADERKRVCEAILNQPIIDKIANQEEEPRDMLKEMGLDTVDCTPQESKDESN